MQEEYLKIASKQTHTWLESAKAGKPYQPEHVIDLARDAMENFAKAQKRFLDVVADETAKATAASSKRRRKKETDGAVRTWRDEATDSLIEAQKRLVDVAGKQMNAGAQSAGKTLEMLSPSRFSR